MPPADLGELVLPGFEELGILRGRGNRLQGHPFVKDGDPMRLFKAAVKDLQARTDSVLPRLAKLPRVFDDVRGAGAVAEPSSPVGLGREGESETLSGHAHYRVAAHSVEAQAGDVKDVLGGKGELFAPNRRDYDPLRGDLPGLGISHQHPLGPRAVREERPQPDGPPCSIALDLGEVVPPVADVPLGRFSPLEGRHLGVGRVPQEGKEGLIDRVPLPAVEALIENGRQAGERLGNHPDAPPPCAQAHRRVLGHPNARVGPSRAHRIEKPGCRVREIRRGVLWTRPPLYVVKEAHALRLPRAAMISPTASSNWTRGSWGRLRTNQVTTAPTLSQPAGG